LRDQQRQLASGRERVPGNVFAAGLTVGLGTDARIMQQQF